MGENFVVEAGGHLGIAPLSCDEIALAPGQPWEGPSSVRVVELA